MKIRNGFVSNSSSASFVIKLSTLTPVQVNMIEHYVFYAKALDAGKGFASTYDENDEDTQYDQTSSYGYLDTPWDIFIDEDAGEISGDTNMTNFDMFSFLRDIGVDDSDVESWHS